MPKNLSQDFSTSLAMLHREVQRLTRDNELLRKELEDVRKLVSSTNDSAVQQRKKATRNAVLSGDDQKIRNLAASATDLTEIELLRAHLPQPQTPPLQGINQKLHKAWVDQYQAGDKQVTQMTFEVEPNINNIDKLRASMQRSQEQARETQLQNQRLQDLADKAAAKRLKETSGRDMNNRSPLWMTPSDF